MRDYLRTHEGEARLFVVLAAVMLFLGFASPAFFSAGNFASLMNNNAVNVIWAVGLLVVLIAGGIDISFAVAASVAQYLTALDLHAVGGGNLILGLLFAGAFGIAIVCINATLIAGFRIISDRRAHRHLQRAVRPADVHDIWQIDLRFARLVDRSRRFCSAWRGRSAPLPVAAMVAAMGATWFLISRTTTGRQLYAFGDNPEGARRAGVATVKTQFIAYGWMGLMAGVGGLMQVNVAQEVVPNALIGRELDVSRGLSCWAARGFGGGRGSVFGCFLGVLLVAVVQNGLNLLGVSPYAFKMVIGLTILAAISFSNVDLASLLAGGSRRRGHVGFH